MSSDTLEVLMKYFKLFSFLGLTLFSFTSLGAGKITAIWHSGPDDPSHANVIQIQIEGGFAQEINAEGCNPNYAAIRNTQERQHMISYLLAAYATKERVGVVLNPADKYYTNGGRCTISRIFSVN